jgi:two-component system sensor histidine kinase YesM
MKGSIRLKLVLLFITVGLVPLLVVASISYFVYYNNILNVTIDTAAYNSDWVVDNINRYFKNVEQISTIIESGSLNHFLREKKDTPADSWEILSLFDLYRRSLFDEKSVHNVTIIGLNGKCHSERDGYYHLDKETINQDPLISAILHSWKSEAILHPIHKASYRKRETVIETIPLGQILLDRTTLEVLGVIIIDIYPEEIQKYYRRVKGDIIGQMDLLYDPDQEVIDTRIPDLNITSLRQGLYIYKEILYDGWYLSYRISYQELIEPIKGVFRLTLIILLFVSVLIIFVFFFISKKIIVPLNLLRVQMEKAAQGDFTTRLNITTNDRDIDELRNSFNKMVYDLENLMKQKEEEHKNYLQAHFRMLQQQINPHFLYNTLDTIVWMSLEKRYDDVIELVESLSTFFRLTLSRGEEMISIPDNILCLESYLSVQKIRYADSLQYNIDISDELKKARILKLILQPIVENALYHGIREKGAGTITISGIQKRDTILFTIHDDGVGMDEGRLKYLIDSLNNPLLKEEDVHSESKGFGLSNVQSRIKLFYGADYGLSIMSEKDKGCTVRIRIPWMS